MKEFTCSISRLGIALTTVLGLLLTRCAPLKDDYRPGESTADASTPRTLESVPAETQVRLFPNELFTAVWTKDKARALGLAQDHPQWLEARNEEWQETPLAMALRLGDTHMAEALASLVTPEHYLDLNKNGESYVLLAARAGAQGVIRELANNHFQSTSNLQDFEFADLDPATPLGFKAVHVARDRRVMEWLEAEYYRGLLEYPWWKFLHATTEADETFLHTAARDGRVDVVNWGRERLCGYFAWEHESSWWKQVLGYTSSRVLRGVQTYVGDFGLPTDLLFNRQNSQGQTALQVALEQQQWAAAQSLSECEWLDYSLTDQDGNNALMTLLAALNVTNPQQAAPARAIFDKLLTSRTQMRMWTEGFAHVMDQSNKDQNTALHLAARLRDSYFYDRLRVWGNTSKVNHLGLTPQQLYTQTRQAYEN